MLELVLSGKFWLGVVTGMVLLQLVFLLAMWFLRGATQGDDT